MATVTITVQTTPVALPVGVVSGLLRISIVGLDSQDVAATSAEFTDVPEGDYVARAARLDEDGVELGESVETEFTVTATSGTTYDAPASLSVSVVP